MNVGLRCLKQRVGIFCITVLFLFFCTAADAKVKSIDYSRGENWAYEDIGANKPVDLFIVAPTVDFGTKEKLNMRAIRLDLLLGPADVLFTGVCQ